MRAGSLDRRITIQQASAAANEFGGQQELTWSTLATVFAQKIENSGQERFAAPQFVGKAAGTFRIRWSSAVKVLTTNNAGFRILFDGREHDIVAVREIGRREGLEIDYTVRSESPVAT